MFGDTSDAGSAVSKAKKQERTYTVLEFLLTKPRCTYLARVRNPNPLMPDYREHPMPRTTEEFNSGPFSSPESETEPSGKGAL